MTDYIIMENDVPAHYFFAPGSGICRREKSGSRWSAYESIYPDASDGFCVYRDANQTTHIICCDSKNHILYLTEKNKKWVKYTISPGNPEIVPLRFLMLPSCKLLNLFYSAGYQDEFILVHCILGDHAQPVIMDKLSRSAPDFFITQGKIYYTNSQGILGFQDFSDGKPGHFSIIAEGGKMPFAYDSDGTVLVAYKQKNLLCINGNPIFEDYASADPILLQRDNRLILQWRSGSFVRYIVSFNGGKTWSAPMRFISNGYSPTIFYAPESFQMLCYYGHNLHNEPILYEYQESIHRPAPQASSSDLPPVFRPQAAAEREELELKKLKIAFELLLKESKRLKQEIAALKTQLDQMNRLTSQASVSQVEPQTASEQDKIQETNT